MIHHPTTEFRERDSRTKRLTIYFASDIHGSDMCFKKFLRAPSHYGADIAILGGDLSGKTIVFVKRDSEGNRIAEIGSQHFCLRNLAEYEQFSQNLADAGVYVTEDDDTSMHGVEAKCEMPGVVGAELRSRLSHWLGLAEKERERTGKLFYWLPGNDDPFFLDDIFAGSDAIQNIDATCIPLSSNLCLRGVGGSNHTPWNTPREYDEEEMGARLRKVFMNCDQVAHSILVSHCPPFNSGIDMAPSLTSDLRIRYGPGGLLTEPVGSTAVREAIEEFQPLLVLCGHVHESSGYSQIRKTLCINPGSNYGKGILCGALVVIEADRVLDFQLVEG